MKQNYSNAVASAIAKCKAEADALKAAQQERDRIENERLKALEALRQMLNQPKVIETERRVINGVEVTVPKHQNDDQAVLSQWVDTLAEQSRAAALAAERAKLALSRAVAERLKPEQRTLENRTREVLEAVTKLCADADALGAAMAEAGLDHEAVYAVRFPKLQDLRLDVVYTEGRAIVDRLETSPTLEVA